MLKRIVFIRGCFASGAFLMLCLAVSSLASPLKLVTARSPQLAPSSGGNGDSVAPIVSADGRYVAFASAANNLDPQSGNYAALMPPVLNVFIRDRVNQTTTLASLNAAGTGGGNSDSVPRGVSTNGQFVLFESAASNLAPGVASGVNNVYVRDVIHASTLPVSVGLNGAPANAASGSAVMTPDGRFVAFSSEASNLVANDTNGIADVFVRDMQAGVTVLASPGATSNSFALAGGASSLPAINSDGRYVAFYSTATNVASGVQTVGEVYLRDLNQGQTIAVSVAAHAAALSLLGDANVFSCSPALSDDGRFVAYETCPTNFFAAATPVQCIVFRYDTQTGSNDAVNTWAAGTPFYSEWGFHGFDMTPDGQSFATTAFNTNSSANTVVEIWNAQTGATTIASVDTNGVAATNGLSNQPMIDASGRYVAFMSHTSGLVTNSVAAGFHLYIRDTAAATTTLADADTNGIGSTPNLAADFSLSADASVIAFAAPDGALVTNDSNQAYDLFARNMASNAVELVSARQPAFPAIAADGPSALTNLSASADGRYVAFASLADDLLSASMGANNVAEQIFVRDLTAGTTTLVSVNTNGLAGNGESSAASISSDGRFVTFASLASDLVPGDTNKMSDIFIRDLQSGTTALASANTAALSTNLGYSSITTYSSYSPATSTNGRYVLFHAAHPNTIPYGDYYGDFLLWRDMETGLTQIVTAPAFGGPISTAAMSLDGQNVAWSSNGLGFSANGPLFIWNAQSGGIIYSNAALNGAVADISPDGARVAFYGSNTFVAVDTVANTNATFSSPYSPKPSARFSADGRYVAYSLPDALHLNQIYLYDFQTGSNLLITASFTGQGTADGNSDSPAISPDGRFVAYRSTAGDLTPVAPAGLPNVYLYDRSTGATTLVNASDSGSTAANGPSLAPIFSGDSKTLFFQSWASDLGSGAFSTSDQIWALSLYSTNVPAPFSANVVAGTPSMPGAGASSPEPTLLWLVTAGKAYQVQYKNELSDAAWQPITAGLVVVGSQGYFRDPAPAAGHRFYRIVSF